jgi:hypothetical protein
MILLDGKPFVAIAVEAASRIYPVRDGFINKDLDKIKRDKLEAAIAVTLREIALEAARQ